LRRVPRIDLSDHQGRVHRYRQGAVHFPRGKYHDAAGKLFATQDNWVQRDTAEQLQSTASELGLDEEGFRTCLQDQAMVDALKIGMEVARSRFKVDSTPTFFVNGTPVRGAYPLSEFRRLIEAKLKS
jgi:protein-disulfide isomerase